MCMAEQLAPKRISRILSQLSKNTLQVARSSSFKAGEDRPARFLDDLGALGVTLAAGGCQRGADGAPVAGIVHPFHEAVRFQAIPQSWVMFDRTQQERSARLPRARGSPASTSLARTPNFATDRPIRSKALLQVRLHLVGRTQQSGRASEVGQTVGGTSFMAE